MQLLFIYIFFSFEIESGFFLCISFSPKNHISWCCNDKI